MGGTKLMPVIVGGGSTVNTAVKALTPTLAEAATVTGVAAATGLVATLKLATVAPAGTITLAGTEAAAGLLLVSETVVPPAGAAAFKNTAVLTGVPPATLDCALPPPKL